VHVLIIAAKPLKRGLIRGAGLIIDIAIIKD
jgi:hypothetical protein